MTLKIFNIRSRQTPHQHQKIALLIFGVLRKTNNQHLATAHELQIHTHQSRFNTSRLRTSLDRLPQSWIWVDNNDSLINTCQVFFSGGKKNQKNSTWTFHLAEKVWRAPLTPPQTLLPLAGLPVVNRSSEHFGPAIKSVETLYIYCEEDRKSTSRWGFRFSPSTRPVPASPSISAPERLLPAGRRSVEPLNRPRGVNSSLTPKHPLRLHC